MHWLSSFLPSSCHFTTTTKASRQQTASRSFSTIIFLPSLLLLLSPMLPSAPVASGLHVFSPDFLDRHRVFTFINRRPKNHQNLRIPSFSSNAAAYADDNDVADGAQQRVVPKRILLTPSGRSLRRMPPPLQQQRQQPFVWANDPMMDLGIRFGKRSPAAAPASLGAEIDDVVTMPYWSSSLQNSRRADADFDDLLLMAKKRNAGIFNKVNSGHRSSGPKEEAADNEEMEQEDEGERMAYMPPANMLLLMRPLAE